MRHPLMIQAFRDRLSNLGFQTVAVFVSAWLVGGQGALLAHQAEPPPAGAQTAPGAPEEASKLSPEQLDSLVAPIALYSDDLLAQCLVASTYPIDVVQAQQWLDKHKDLKGEALSKEAMKQSWDPSIQALTGIPDALKVLSQDIKWTTDLGDAVLAQQADVMAAVQRMRGKAKEGGKLATNEQMKVETKVVEQKEVIVIEQASPDVVVVPSYSPSVVYGAAPYPYPPLYYPPYYPGAGFVSFGIGVAVGVGISGGWGCGWGGNNEININNNNTFVNNSNRQNNVSNRSGNSNWSHNSAQRGGAPYKDKATANKYGGGARGDAASRQGGRGGASASARDAGRGGGGGRSGAGGAGGFSGGSGSSGFSGGGDRVGSRDTGGGFGGGSSRSGSSSGFSGSGGGGRSAGAASSRGSSSFSSGSRGGGGGSRGGGGGGRRR